MKKKKIMLLALGIMGVLPLMAQGSRHFTIDGEMTHDSMRYEPKAIQKVYLKHIVNGEEVLLDSAIVKNRRFHFEGTAPEFTEAAMITGFDNGAVQLLLEPGNIKVLPFDAHFPTGAKAEGTTNNDIFKGYVLLHGKNADDAKRNIDNLRKSLPDSIIKDDMKYMPYHSAMFNANGVYYKVDVMDYFLKHIDSEAALFILKYDLYYMYKPQVLHDVFMKAMPERLHEHPIYKELANQLLTNQMGEGSAAPDFSAKGIDGKSLSLSQLKGKFVFLDIWASWCAPCRREIPFVKQSLAEAASSDNFKVLSYSIDSKKDEWVNCINKNQMTDKNWIHVSTLKGWGSDIVRLYNVRGVPHTVLIDPQGNIVKFNLRGEELVKTVKDILSKPFKAKKVTANKEVELPTVEMPKYVASTDADKKVAAEYEKIAKQKGLSPISMLENKLKFILDHNNSSFAPYALERDFFNILDKAYNQRLSNAFSPDIQDSPYYKSYVNKVAALLEDDDK